MCIISRLIRINLRTDVEGVRPWLKPSPCLAIVGIDRLAEMRWLRAESAFEQIRKNRRLHAWFRCAFLAGYPPQFSQSSRFRKSSPIVSRGLFFLPRAHAQRG